MSRAKGAAAAAGLRAGDVIVNWDGIVNPVYTQIQKDIRKYPDADQPVWILRDGESKPQMLLVRPQTPFRLTGGSKPSVGIGYRGEIDEWHLVLARVEKDSPMGEAGLTAGDRITALAGQKVANWYELINHLKQNAGKTVSITYVNQDNQAQTGQLAIPRSLYAELGLSPWPNSVIIAINGEKSVQATQPDGSIREYSVSIPEGIHIALQQNVGKTIAIEYQVGDQVKTADVKVTPNLVDPWFMQIQFVQSFMTYNEQTELQTSNPLVALDWGVRRTWYLLINTYITIKQMLFTQQIGVENLSGPVGIVRIGTQVAEAGIPQTALLPGVFVGQLRRGQLPALPDRRWRALHVPADREDQGQAPVGPRADGHTGDRPGDDPWRLRLPDPPGHHYVEQAVDQAARPNRYIPR